MRLLVLLFSLSFCFCTCKSKIRNTADSSERRSEKNSWSNPDSILSTALSYVYRPGEEKRDLDSAISLARQVESQIRNRFSDKLLPRIYFVYAVAYREAGDTSLGHHYIQLCVPLMEKQGAGVELADAYKEQAYYYGIDAEADVISKKILFEKALKLYLQSDNKEKTGYALKFIADLEQLLGNYGKALSLLNESLKYYKQCNCKGLEAVYDLMGTVSIGLGDYTNAVKYGLLAVQAAEKFGDTSLQMATIYNRIAVAYSRWSRSDEAAFYGQKAMAFALKFKDRQSVYTILPTVSRASIFTENWKEAFTTAKKVEATIPPHTVIDSVYLFSVYALSLTTGKQYIVAENYTKQLKEIIKRYKKSSPDLGLELAYRAIIHYLEKTKQAAKLRLVALDWLVYSKYNNNLSGLKRAYQSLSTADSAMGLYKEALWAYMNYSRINDSLFNQTKSMQFAQLQVLHETDKKTAEISIKQKDIALLKNQNILQEYRLMRSNTTRNIVIWTAGVLLIIISAAYFFQQRHTRELEEKQAKIDDQNVDLKKLLSQQDKLLTEKEWLVKEIHHRVKNNLQIIISLFNAQSEYADHPSVVQAIREGQERMQAIALLHQSLYGPERDNTIAMNSYIPDLITNLERSAADNGHVRFHLEVDSIELDISQAVPVGLILNEAITNSLKHAFQANEKGLIEVFCKVVDHNMVELRVKDNGVGISVQQLSGDTKSLGLQLIQLFSEQLEGKLIINNASGTEVLLHFKTRKLQPEQQM